MCGRIVITNAALARALNGLGLKYDPGIPWESRYNIPPTTAIPAVRLNKEAKREAVRLKWGLIPSWAKDAKMAYSTINARADTVATKPAFRSAYKKRRCLILADGYYEWLREGKDRQPFVYQVDGGEPFAMAGLWESWDGSEGKNEPVESCTIITTDANKLCAEIHDRMPVILDAKQYDAWLNCEDVPLVPFSADRMTARLVSRYVNKVGNEGEECLASPDCQTVRADSSRFPLDD